MQHDAGAGLDGRLFPESGGIADDVRRFLLHRPRIPTRIALGDRELRARYGDRILQRIGMKVDAFGVLNIHRIAIDAPVALVFDELSRWGSDCEFWPNRLAHVVRRADRLDRMRVLLFGRRSLPLGLGHKLLGLRLVPLFRLHALRIQADPASPDNARYLLYECTGGYPIGFLAIYVRSPIPAEGESGEAQLFFGVGFDFYGRRDWSNLPGVRRLWGLIHDRATSNILNRIKRICETRFHHIREGGDAGEGGPAEPLGS